MRGWLSKVRNGFQNHPEPVAQRQMNVEMMPPDKQAEQGQDGNSRQQIVAVVKQAPGRAGVFPVDKFEEARNNHPFLGWAKEAQDKKLGRLVKHKDNQREQSHAAICGPVHRLKTTFVPASKSCNARLSRRRPMNR